jgi:hypothetical protein
MHLTNPCEDFKEKKLYHQMQPAKVSDRHQLIAGGTADTLREIPEVSPPGTPTVRDHHKEWKQIPIVTDEDNIRAANECLPLQMISVKSATRRWEIGKAATLVMLQLPAPARERTAWIHAPSQPLM